MLKNIFRSRKKSKSVILTSNSNGDAGQTPVRVLTPFNGEVASLANTKSVECDTPYSERAIDVCFDSGHLSLGCSVENIPDADVGLYDMLNNFSSKIHGGADSHKKVRSGTLTKHKGDEEVSSGMSGVRRNTFSQLYPQSVKYQDDSCKQTPVQASGSKDVLMVDAVFSDCFDAGSNQFQNCMVRSRTDLINNKQSSQPSFHADALDFPVSTSSTCPGEVDESIPQLVPIDFIKHETISECSMQPAAMSSGVDSNVPNINESEMFILTDSFLDNTSASYVNYGSNRPNASLLNQSPSKFDVMVADDYEPQTVMVNRHPGDLFSANFSCQPTVEGLHGFPNRCDSPHDVESHAYSRPIASNDKCRQKPVSDWSAPEVLTWMLNVGLGQFYQAFKTNNVVGRDISIISTKFLDRLQIFGQADRELVLRQLYLLHAPGMSSTQHPTSSGQFTVSRAWSAAVNADSDRDTMSLQTENDQNSPVIKQLCFDELSLQTSHHEFSFNSDTSIGSVCEPGDGDLNETVNGYDTSALNESPTYAEDTLAVNVTFLPDCQTASPSDIDQKSLQEMVVGLETEKSQLLQTVSSLSASLTSKDLLIDELNRRLTELESQIKQNKSEPNTDDDDEERSSSIYDLLLTTSQKAEVLAIELQKGDDGSLDFMLGADCNDRPIVKHTEHGSQLLKGDRLLEVNSRTVHDLSDTRLYKLLRDLESRMKIVVIRKPESSGRRQSSGDDVEAVKEDLALALLEVEALQQENQALTDELSRLKKACLDEDEDMVD